MDENMPDTYAPKKEPEVIPPRTYAYQSLIEANVQYENVPSTQADQPPQTPVQTTEQSSAVSQNTESVSDPITQAPVQPPLPIQSQPNQTIPIQADINRHSSINSNAYLYQNNYDYSAQPFPVQNNLQNQFYQVHYQQYPQGQYQQQGQFIPLPTPPVVPPSIPPPSTVENQGSSQTLASSPFMPPPSPNVSQGNPYENLNAGAYAPNVSQGNPYENLNAEAYAPNVSQGNPYENLNAGAYAPNAYQTGTFVVTPEEPKPTLKKKGFNKKTLFLIILLVIVVGVAIALTVVLVNRNAGGKGEEQKSSSSSSASSTTSDTPSPTPAPNFTSTRLDAAFPLSSPNNNTVAKFDADFCKFSLEVGNNEAWRTPVNSFFNCQMHLVNNGNLYMFQPSTRTIVWRALNGGGRDLGHRYDLYVSNNGTAFLYDLTAEVAYWSVP